MNNTFCNTDEFSCDNTYPNLLIWCPDYNIIDGQIIVKMNMDKGNVYRLPINGDIEVGIDYIRKCENCDYPVFWNSEGKRLDEFRNRYGDKFSIMLPAYDNLYDYYSKLGYNAIAATSKIISQNENIICNNDLVEYADNFKKYCLQSAICNGSYIQKAPCIICTTYDVDSEIYTIFDCYPDICGNIIYTLKFKSKIYLPDNNGKEKFGMIKNLDKTNRNGIFPWLTNK